MKFMQFRKEFYVRNIKTKLFNALYVFKCFFMRIVINFRFFIQNSSQKKQSSDCFINRCVKFLEILWSWQKSLDVFSELSDERIWRIFEILLMASGTYKHFVLTVTNLIISKKVKLSFLIIIVSTAHICYIHKNLFSIVEI